MIKNKLMISSSIIMLLIAILAGYGAKRIQLLRIDPELIHIYPLPTFIQGWFLFGALFVALWLIYEALIKIYFKVGLGLYTILGFICFAPCAFLSVCSYLSPYPEWLVTISILSLIILIGAGFLYFLYRYHHKLLLPIFILLCVNTIILLPQMEPIEKNFYQGSLPFCVTQFFPAIFAAKHFMLHLWEPNHQMGAVPVAFDPVQLYSWFHILQGFLPISMLDVVYQDWIASHLYSYLAFTLSAIFSLFLFVRFFKRSIPIAIIFSITYTATQFLALEFLHFEFEHVALTLYMPGFLFFALRLLDNPSRSNIFLYAFYLLAILNCGYIHIFLFPMWAIFCFLFIFSYWWWHGHKTKAAIRFFLANVLALIFLSYRWLSFYGFMREFIVPLWLRLKNYKFTDIFCSYGDLGPNYLPFNIFLAGLVIIWLVTMAFNGVKKSDTAKRLLLNCCLALMLLLVLTRNYAPGCLAVLYPFRTLTSSIHIFGKCLELISLIATVYFFIYVINKITKNNSPVEDQVVITFLMLLIIFFVEVKVTSYSFTFLAYPLLKLLSKTNVIGGGFDCLMLFALCFFGFYVLEYLVDKLKARRGTNSLWFKEAGDMIMKLFIYFGPVACYIIWFWRRGLYFSLMVNKSILFCYFIFIIIYIFNIDLTRMHRKSIVIITLLLVGLWVFVPVGGFCKSFSKFIFSRAKLPAIAKMYVQSMPFDHQAKKYLELGWLPGIPMDAHRYIEQASFPDWQFYNKKVKTNGSYTNKREIQWEATCLYSWDNYSPEPVNNSNYRIFTYHSQRHSYDMAFGWRLLNTFYVAGLYYLRGLGLNQTEVFLRLLGTNSYHPTVGSPGFMVDPIDERGIFFLEMANCGKIRDFLDEIPADGIRITKEGDWKVLNKKWPRVYIANSIYRIPKTITLSPEELISRFEGFILAYKPGMVALSEAAAQKVNNVIGGRASVDIRRIYDKWAIFEVDAEAPSVAVYSDAYAKDWHAYSDSTEIPVVRANFIFKAFLVPAGKHKVWLEYRPKYFFMGIIISLGAIITTIALLLYGYSKKE